MKTMINKILENEFHHIQEHHESNDLKDNKEMETEREYADTMFEKIFNLLPEDKRFLLYEYESAISNFDVDIARYYFRKGVEMGVTNLDFMKDYTDML